MPMPPALLAAMERKKKGKGGKPMGKSIKSKPDNAAEDKLDGGADDATETKSSGSMPPGLAAYMAKHHGKK